jgi:hypothetical protein
VALVVPLLGSAYAADNSNSGPTNEQQLQQEHQTTQEPATKQQQTTGDLTEREQAYLSALKECEAMDGTQKQQCVDRIKKEYGHQ